MKKLLYFLPLFFLLGNCGGLDPRKLADEYCDCAKKYSATESWRCDSIAIRNNRKMKNNEEAVRAYNVRLKDCMEGN
jgi:hypothetical protein